MNRSLRVAVSILFLLLSFHLFAQSIPLATLSGRVTSEGAVMPGVTVSVTSPQLQGTRSTETTGTGDYILPLLPPGSYTVKFELSGMRSVTRKVTLAAALAEKLDVELRQEAMAESITVTAESPLTASIETTQVSTNFKQSMIEQLPTSRDIRNVALLAPGVNNGGPGGNLIISGAMSFDSLYLVNGAIVNENLRGQPHNLFIEDAVQETTVLSAGVSAEYGHFTGGVVNAITKSGGNDFSGSLRSNLANESWISKTPFTADQEDKINDVWEGTLGGPFMRDRIWFFGAGRYAKTDDIRQTEPGLARAGDQDANGTAYAVGAQLPAVTFPHATKETRGEGKVTGAITQKHSLILSYLDIDASETNQTGQVIMDLDSLVPARETPNTFFVGAYNGILSSKAFVEAQYSKKEFAFLHSGSPYYDIVKGTLITDRARGTRYWSPTFRNTPEGEHRDIRAWAAKGTYFWSTPAVGTHEIKLGYEDFNEVRLVNNYQNGSDYRISVPNTIVRGGTVYSRMPGGATGTLTRISWLPIFVLSQGSDYTTKSTFFNDQWSLNNRWTFNLGVRYDKNDAISGDHTFTISDDATFSPRLGMHFDTFGDGRLIFTAGYGHYVGRLSEGAGNDADPAGRNASLQWDYRGPNINNDVNVPTSQLIPTDQAVKMVMDWFFANGGTSRRPFRTSPSIPGVNVIIGPDGLKSPIVREYTFGAATKIGSRGFARADFVHRKWGNFYTEYTNTSTGKVTDPLTSQQFDLSVIETNDDVYAREYTGLQTQFRYRVLERLNVGGNYTWSRLTGNVIGENTGSGPLVGGNADYPEYVQESWNYPTGYISGDQRHRLKAWAAYDLPTHFGNFNFSLLQSYDSANATSADGVIDSRPYVTNPGYLTPPASVTYYFGGRGTLKTDDITRTDLAINYSYRIRNIEFFIQPEMLNVFNEQGVVSFDEQVLSAVDCPQTGTLSADCYHSLAPFNPFTTTPVEGVNYDFGPNFGKPTSESDYQTPRTFRFSLGIRF